MAYRPIPDKAVTIMDLYNQATGKTQSPVIPKQQVPEEKLGKLSKTIQPNGGVEKSVIEPIKEPFVKSIKEVPREPIKAISKEPIKKVPKEPIKLPPTKSIQVPREPVKPLIDPQQPHNPQKLHMQKTMEELNLQRDRLKENLQSLSRRDTHLQTNMDEWVRRAREHHMPPHQYQEMMHHSGELNQMKSRMGDINRQRGEVQSRLNEMQHRVGELRHRMASLSPNQMSPSGHNKIIR